MREQQRDLLKASTTGSLSGEGIRAMQSPKPGRPSMTWKKNRNAVPARFMRA